MYVSILMESLTEASLVGTIVQFIDFSLEVVSKGSELLKFADGRLTQHTDIVVVGDELKRLATKLSISATPPGSFVVLNEDETALALLCNGCWDVAQQLRAAIDALQWTGHSKKWKSLRVALKTIWSKEKLAALQQRLIEYRSQLDTDILVGLKARIDNIELRQSEWCDRLDDGPRATSHAVLQSSANTKLSLEQEPLWKRSDDEDDSDKKSKLFAGPRYSNTTVSCRMLTRRSGHGHSVADRFTLDQLQDWFGDLPF